ncbi:MULTISPECIES: hypothetical protein [unclassified Streptomyces]|uniref:hypothetical protein n=1 Tax=unclassified Streptomyces TaxID=2593676 RepID=UPI00236540B7|nr:MULTISPECIES: hypothetical protein [unclassified Streptomyces]MDF3144977.1 hypothetical protein [Streptomyces sp. T21Q-yed]WDF41526.1 hypothetical protein PBV52_34395 [Streptomyces sp. T12]
MKASRKARSAAIAIPAAAVAVLGMAPMAHAEARPTCPDWEKDCAVFYYNSDKQGSRTAFTHDGVSNLTGYTFLSSGNGKGLPVKNGAASFWNASVGSIATVFIRSNYGGACDTFAPLADTKKLAKTYNENASFDFDRNGDNYYKWDQDAARRKVAHDPVQASDPSSARPPSPPPALTRPATPTPNTRWSARRNSYWLATA